MSEFIKIIREIAEGQLDNASDFIVASMGVVAALLVLASLIALCVSIYLAVSYIKYNRTKNSAGKTGEQVARAILDKNGLQKIKVSKNGSLLFGNSYSHYFKKVRLRRFTWQKSSVTSLAMAAQKSSLAILDKEGDKDMRTRVKLTPFIYFGPLAFIPMVAVGVLLDIFVLKNGRGTIASVFLALGLVFYIISFVMSVLELKTEKKAQIKAIEILTEEGLATSAEIGMVKSLFRLYNIEYINNMVIALLELIYRILQIIGYVSNNSNGNG